MNRIILKGYYGYGNLGDDILMKVSSRLLKQMYPHCYLSVVSACKNCDYILPFTDGMVEEVIPLSPEPKADLVVHGGGGTYFDFDKGTILYYLLNSGIDLMGINIFGKGLNTYRKLKGWPSNSSANRAALGVGIGTFTSSSKKYYYKMAELSNFDLILPRDHFSYRFLKKKNVKGTVIPATDLAFLKEFWIPSGKSLIRPNRRSVGFVLRSWNDDSDYLTVVQQVAKALDKEGYKVSIFNFEKAHDRHIEQRFQDFNIFTWCPNTTSLDQYLEILTQNSLLVTSRAHGAILGAAFGIPSVCIGIEPKLLSVAKMFPLSGSYVGFTLTFKELYNSVKEGLKVKTENVNLDFENNRRVLLSSLKEFKRLLEHKNNGLD